MKAPVVLYKAVVKTVLLYGCDIWVVTDTTMTALEGFHHRVARRLAGLMARRGNNGEWEFSPVAMALEVTGLWLMQEHVRRR